MTVISSISIGFVWGWLFLLFKFPAQRLPRLIGLLTFAVATALLSLQIYLFFLNIQTIVIFFLAMAFSFILHVSWRKSIRDKNKSLRNIPIS
jgi:positive regulator of sigma E activity